MLAAIDPDNATSAHVAPTLAETGAISGQQFASPQRAISAPKVRKIDGRAEAALRARQNRPTFPDTIGTPRLDIAREC